MDVIVDGSVLICLIVCFNSHFIANFLTSDSFVASAGEDVERSKEFLGRLGANNHVS
jgi:hypothetical protein